MREVAKRSFDWGREIAFLSPSLLPHGKIQPPRQSGPWRVAANGLFANAILYRQEKTLSNSLLF
jgi:hypothetical protein